MKFQNRRSSMAVVISGILGSSSFSSPVMAEEFAGIERIQVTASRRLTSVEDLPYNISVSDSDSLAKAGITDQAELGLTIPGLTVVDTGARNDSPMMIRGLSVDELSANDGGGNGGTVSVYINDTPMLVDLSLLDINRVEVLRGPQGTLYGAGSLGGTLKYILNQPELDENSLSVSSRLSHIDHSSGLSQEYQAIGNLAVIEDKLAIRLAYNWTEDQGFIDYTEVLSDPQQDVNKENTKNIKLALAYSFNDEILATLTHIQQQQKVGGRQAVNSEFTGSKFANAARFIEPADKDVTMDTLEISWQGDAYRIVSSSSYSQLKDLGQRDQTDLLTTSIWPGYGDYEDFRAYTRDTTDNSNFVQELRLQYDDSDLINWTVGLYYANEDNNGQSIEFTPGYPEYLGLERPDNIEYYSDASEKVIEKALFGELTWFVTDDWNLTLGARFFDLEQSSYQCLDFPIDEGMAGDEFSFECSNGAGSNQDSIFKFSSFYEVTDDFNFYLTMSEGFRRGGSNGVPEGGQVDFTEDEKSFDPDSVTNYELGWHATMFDNSLAINGSLYHIDWTDLQLSGKTSEGAIPITVNGGSATSQGLELESVWVPISGLQITAGYAYTRTKLSEDAPSLDGFNGDHVPGVPTHEGSITASFEHSLGHDWNAQWFAGLFMKSSVTTRVNSLVGTKNEDNQTLAGFGIVNSSVKFTKNQWGLRLFANNLLNKYAIVGARGKRDYGEQGQLLFINKPRTVGVELSYQF
ncbi:TonB-dependent receptor [Shewanella sp. 202IG2-18]|uniref:TonB-dependent receptor n=1 Tax=Parashewanella hymeniacidonis TaxID=2807618 RepID=UPI0019616902|nr:TonB-dependent receptor [Parashewanella hymeniacidonis]MBM7071843.1 TonB-dependent receptor [Parashewanella hymeniacidonis]